MTLSVLAGLLAAAQVAVAPAPEPAADPYYKDAQQALAAALAEQPNTGRARNVILFIGDGMGVSTLTAGRIFDGQSRGADGPSNRLSFERFPYVALSKTYSHDTMVTDSANGASAITTGVKTKNRLLGVTGAARSESCEDQKRFAVPTIGELAKQAGYAVGVVTTTRITHATPAALYGHIGYRDWEADSDMPPEAVQGGCPDLARQLVEAGSLRVDVALGGGRARFLPEGEANGLRADGRDLLAAWTAGAPGSRVVTTAAELKAAPAAGPLLGLFGRDHLPYEADRAILGEGVPTLSEMTAKAIEVLVSRPKGFVLLVEGGNIDRAHHLNAAKRALLETQEFARAVQVAMDKTDPKDTLILVTADHSHTLAINGYSARNAPILGLAGNEGEPIVAADGKPFTVLTYGTGPGGPSGADLRDDPSKADLEDVDTLQQATANLRSAAHGGEDVPVYARGPQAYLVRGSIEPTLLFQIMRRALGLNGRSR